MTHDELLAKIKTGYEFLGITYAPDSHTFALRAVVELHKPYINYRGDEAFCNYCESEGMTADYPCKSIRAIEKELK